jgi:small subunit ribosomal protein S27Ae
MPKEKKKKEKKKTVPSRKWKYYKIEGNKLKRAKYCPRCGPGIFMSQHKNRKACGRCGYTEFLNKK